MSELVRVEWDDGRSIIISLSEENHFNFLASWPDKCLLFGWVRESNISNLFELTMLKLGLIWPFVYYKKCIRDTFE